MPNYATTQRRWSSSETRHPMPEGWNRDAPFHFADNIEAAMSRARELAGNRTVEVARGDVRC
ncbi:hypothetical protein [Nonomuraea sp. PA05]|uniref:hypothetical protein n=1 Tax=Nonomuraea sp. PA05 TaxID=2604466 RepID=UPI001651DBB4|nr:hypothetical protein [Nonomuraea sp. PA05]